jgi:hypothetical protein
VKKYKLDVPWEINIADTVGGIVGVVGIAVVVGIVGIVVAGIANTDYTVVDIGYFRVATS